RDAVVVAALELVAVLPVIRLVHRGLVGILRTVRLDLLVAAGDVVREHAESPRCRWCVLMGGHLVRRELGTKGITAAPPSRRRCGRWATAGLAAGVRTRPRLLAQGCEPRNGRAVLRCRGQDRDPGR